MTYWQLKVLVSEGKAWVIDHRVAGERGQARSLVAQVHATGEIWTASERDGRSAANRWTERDIANLEHQWRIEETAIVMWVEQYLKGVRKHG